MTPEQLQQLKEAAKRLYIARNSLAFNSAIEAIDKPGMPVICGMNTGRGKWSTSKSWQYDTFQLLKAAGYEAICFNEAPKGGKQGDRIYIRQSK